jgi:PhzF family phenazine biosynthesis protein
VSVRIRIIDAFTDRPFAGNPAAVCILDGAESPDVQWMAQVAGEMNLPMTAFARRLDNGDWELRWFSALMAEEKFCGHATLATAHALFSDGRADDTVRFDTCAGILLAEAQPSGRITLDFPAASVSERETPEGLVNAFAGVRPQATYGTGALRDLLALFDSEAAVRALQPDLDFMASFTRSNDIRGVIATAPADAGAPHDFVSRFFDPADGYPEDAVTGSAHTALAPFWSARLGRTRLTAFQASRRTGSLEIEVAGDRVRLTGGAVTVLDGSLLVG